MLAVCDDRIILVHYSFESHPATSCKLGCLAVGDTCPHHPNPYLKRLLHLTAAPQPAITKPDTTMRLPSAVDCAHHSYIYLWSRLCLGEVKAGSYLCHSLCAPHHMFVPPACMSCLLFHQLSNMNIPITQLNSGISPSSGCGSARPYACSCLAPGVLGGQVPNRGMRLQGSKCKWQLLPHAERNTYACTTQA